MALPAVKHLDPVVGVDVHSVLVTPGTPPVFLPHPHVGFMLDKREYLQAAKAVVGCIAKMIAQEKVTQYIEDHPEDVKKLEHLADEANHLADEANQQVNNQINALSGSMGGGNSPDFMANPIVAGGVRFAEDANQLKNRIETDRALGSQYVDQLKSRISDDLGSNVGAGGGSGRPIFVNGMMRATAGTHAYHVPGLHFPLGESFAPPPEEVEPSNDGESFMGSKTVLANNDPLSYMALEALSCWSIGMEPPPHNSAHTNRTYPSMPSSVMLPIPAGRPVLVGGPPIMNMAAAAKGLFKSFQGSDWAKTLADKLHLKSGFLRCNVLKAEPVDATTGEVVVQQSDFTVSGRLPLVWERYYSSHNLYRGAIGAGWQTPADIRLELMPHNGEIGAVACFPDHSTAFDALPADDGWPAHVYDWQYGYGLYRRDNRLILRTREGIEYGFVLPRQGVRGIGDYAQRVLLTERMADLNGNAWVFERDEHGCVIRISEWTRDGPTARVVGCDTRAEAYTAAWLTRLTLIDGEGNAHPLVTYEQDDAENLRAAIDAMAQPHRFDYTDGHRMVGHTSARGVSFYYSHRAYDDGLWRVDRAWGDEGLFEYRFTYDVARKETLITDSRGYTSALQLNERNMPVAETDPLGGVTNYQYDSQGRTNVRTDPAGHATKWNYDRYGNLVTQTLANGSTIRTEYDSNQNPVCVTSIGGLSQRYKWNTRHNLIAKISPSGAISHYSYDRYGQLVEHIGPRSAITRFSYDQDGNPAVLLNALGHRTWYRHDARGNLVETINALGQRNRYAYDRNGNLTRAVESGGREIDCTYDADGNLIRYRDPTGHVTQIDYSPLGQIAKRHSPDGTSIEFKYDTEGQLIGVVNERGELYSLERDALGRIVVEMDYWGQARRYRYGSAGELLASVDPSGLTIEYRYDRLGRIIQKRMPEQERVSDINLFEYDSNGNLETATNLACRVEFRYDKEGRVVQELQNNDFTITNAYDASGNRTERRTRLISDGKIIEHIVRYSFDELDAVTSIQIDDTDPVILNRDELGRVFSEHIGKNLRHERSYEPSGQLESQRTLLTNTGILFASEYSYDANGELVEKRDSHNGTDRFQYDLEGRIIAHIDPMGRLHHFLHDPVGDLLKTPTFERTTPGTTDSTTDGKWIRAGTYDDCYVAYDQTGNLIRKQDKFQNLTLRWDAIGQLVEANTKSTETSDKVISRYKYDPLGRRIAKITQTTRMNGVDQQLSLRTHHFYWDGDMLAGEQAIVSCERSSARTHDIEHAQEWIYYPDSFELSATVRSIFSKNDLTSTPENRLYFYQNDPNGAPIRMHDENGEIIWDSNYTPTGNCKYIEYQLIGQPIRLQGQYFDAETGLNYNRNRYFDPAFGNFISQDPIGLLGGVNPYQFAPNIFGWIDPLGLQVRPGGACTLDSGKHGELSPGLNRAPGHQNTRSDDFIQSHHPVQNEWAEHNIPNYKRNDAPAILLPSSSGMAHAKISAAQRALRRKLSTQPGGKWGSTSLADEFKIGYRQMIDAGVPENIARSAFRKSYKYFSSLGAI